MHFIGEGTSQEMMAKYMGIKIGFNTDWISIYISNKLRKMIYSAKWKYSGDYGLPLAIFAGYHFSNHFVNAPRINGQIVLTIAAR